MKFGIFYEHQIPLREAERERRKAAQLAPFIARAMARKKAMKPSAENELPTFAALGRSIAGEGRAGEERKRRADPTKGQ
jgi:hypothetical protein